MSEEYFNNREKNLNIEENKSISKKIILIPYLDESNKKWGIIILFNLYNEQKEIIAKLITTNNNNDNVDIILNSLIKNIRININNKERKFTFDIFNINDNNKINNSSIFFINFINKFIEQNENDIEEYIIKILNNNNVQKYNDNENEINDIQDKNKKNLENEEENNEIDILFSNEELFNNLIKEYEFETNKKLINNKNNGKKEKSIKEQKSKIKKNIKEENNEQKYNIDILAKQIAKNIMSIEMKKSWRKNLPLTGSTTL
jgi:hypothetical protein